MWAYKGVATRGAQNGVAYDAITVTKIILRASLGSNSGKKMWGKVTSFRIEALKISTVR